MMGRTHVGFGAVCALGVAAAGVQVVGVLHAPDVLLAVAQTSGYALLPDLDHRASIAVKSIPPLTILLHYLTVWTHRIVYASTRRAHDPPSRSSGRPRARVRSLFGSERLALTLFGAARPWRSAHRGLSHSVLVAGFVGVLAGLAAWLHPVAAVLVILFGLLVGDRLVFAVPITILYGLSSAVYFGPYGATEHLSDMAVLWGLATAVGLVSHSLGDSCTKMGVALLAPYSWRMYRSRWHFGTNGVFERKYLKWILGVLALYFVGVLISAWWPGVLPGVLRLIFRAG